MTIIKVFRSNVLGKTWHGGQTRKYTGLPYFSHCEDVHDTFMGFKKLDKTFKIDEELEYDMRATCNLHDTLEDCPDASEAKITETCGENVTRLVLELTNPSKGYAAMSRAYRKQMDRDHLANVSLEARIIKLIDRTCNLSDLHLCPSKDFIRLYCKESGLLLDALTGTNSVLEINLENTMRHLYESCT